MKRRVTARCAAANDNEGGSSASGDEQPAAGSGAERRRSPPRKKTLRSVAPEGGVPGGRRKKEKEFAWMDSEEEEEEDPGDSGCVDKDGKREAPDADEGGDDDVGLEALDTVQSFGRMMLLAPAIGKRLRGGKMSPEDVVAACRALGRTKFFDADILKDLSEVLIKLLTSDQLSIPAVNDVVMCLWELNAYDEKVFSAVATALRPKIPALEQTIRSSWLEVYKAFNHAREQDFLQLLEVPPLSPISPGYQRLRCRFIDKGSCALGSACTYSHDSKAPIAMEDITLPHRQSPLVMTQNQYTMGRSVYGGARNGQFSGT